LIGRLSGENYGSDWEAIGYTSQDLVDAYRDAHPLIAGVDTGREYKGHKIREGGMWKDMHRAFKAVVEGESNEEYVARCTFKRLGADVLTVLPSGRFVRYRDVRMEPIVPSWGGDPKDTITYLTTRGYRSSLFASKIAQNCVQAVARDLLYFALANCRERGLKVAFHVHDEVICEGSVGELLESCMTDLPSWAEGIPVEAEAEEYGCYRK